MNSTSQGENLPQKTAPPLVPRLGPRPACLQAGGVGLVSYGRTNRAAHRTKTDGLGEQAHEVRSGSIVRLQLEPLPPDGSSVDAHFDVAAPPDPMVRHYFAGTAQKAKLVPATAGSPVLLSEALRKPDATGLSVRGETGKLGPLLKPLPEFAPLAIELVAVQPGDDADPPLAHDSEELAIRRGAMQTLAAGRGGGGVAMTSQWSAAFDNALTSIWVLPSQDSTVGHGGARRPGHRVTPTPPYAHLARPT